MADKKVFQVNLHCGTRPVAVSALALQPIYDRENGRRMGAVVYGASLADVFKIIKAKYNLKAQDISLEFQPED